MTILRYDPTRTTTLRRMLSTALNTRVLLFDRDVREYLLKRDIARWQEGNHVWEVTEFEHWLERHLSARFHLGQWWMRFLVPAYLKGVGRSYTEGRKGVPEEQRLGGRNEFIRGVLTPISLRGISLNARQTNVSTNPHLRLPLNEKLESLSKRFDNEIKGVTTDIAKRLARGVLDGLEKGRNPRAVAKELSRELKGIPLPRLQTIARTEMIRAHAEGQLDGMERLGIRRVGVQVEWIATPDARVCKLCAEMNGKTFPLQEARGKIPLHPNCRCAWTIA